VIALTPDARDRLIHFFQIRLEWDESHRLKGGATEPDRRNDYLETHERIIKTRTVPVLDPKTHPRFLDTTEARAAPTRLSNTTVRRDRSHALALALLDLLQFGLQHSQE
jgi:hypothetical protein